MHADKAHDRPIYGAVRRGHTGSADPKTLFPLQCNEETGSLVADVELEDAITVATLRERWFTWFFQVAAPDPRKYAVEWQAMSTGLAQYCR